MRSLLALILVGGCSKPEAPPADTVPAPADPGPVECSVAKKPQQGGFAPWYDSDAPHLLVHGDSPEEAAFAAEMHAYYAAFVPDLELKAAAAVTEADRSSNLMIMGTPSSNAVLAELVDLLPVALDDGSFTFGGYTYDEPGNGIALIAPSPWADAWLTVYTGNTWAGAYSTFTIFTGAYDYVTTRGRGVVQQEGYFCREDAGWFYWPDYLELDDRADFLAWRDDLEQVASEHHVFYFTAGSDFDVDRDWMPEWQEERYDDILTTLEIDALDAPIATYLYDSNAEKGTLTGISGNGHANDLNLEVHAVYGGGVYAVGAHEDVHVVAWHRIGDTSYTLMGEGLAVMVDGVWLGETLDDFAASTAAAGGLVPLATLVDDFWSEDDIVTYGLAGHFVQFLIDRWGVDTVKRLYVATDLEQAFLDELGLTLEELEAEWLTTIG